MLATAFLTTTALRLSPALLELQVNRDLLDLREILVLQEHQDITELPDFKEFQASLALPDFKDLLVNPVKMEPLALLAILATTELRESLVSTAHLV